MLSPVALAVVLLYSYTKRFTRCSHLVLGFALGIAPAAAWIAVLVSLIPAFASDGRGNLLGRVALTCFMPARTLILIAPTASIPSRSLLAFRERLSWPGCCTLRCWFSVALLLTFGLGKIAVAGVIAVALLLAYEHSLVSSHDLSKLNAAFFTMNGVIAVVFFLFIAADLLTRR